MLSEGVKTKKDSLKILGSESFLKDFKIFNLLHLILVVGEGKGGQKYGKGQFPALSMSANRLILKSYLITSNIIFRC